MQYLSWQDKGTVELIVEKLAQNGVILSTTDTVIGLLASVTAEGFMALDTLKKRERKPYIILVGSIEQAQEFIEPLFFTKIKSFLLAIWPAPVTIIMPAYPSLNWYTQAHNGSVALRMPDHQGLQMVLAQGNGLFSTSANISGEPVPTSLREVSATIQQEVDLVVTDDGWQESAVAIPSTIIDIRSGDLHLVRQGAIALEDIQRVYMQQVTKDSDF